MTINNFIKKRNKILILAIAFIILFSFLFNIKEKNKILSKEIIDDKTLEIRFIGEKIDIDFIKNKYEIKPLAIGKNFILYNDNNKLKQRFYNRDIFFILYCM